MVHEGQSKRVHAAFMRAPLSVTFGDPNNGGLFLNVERDRLGSLRRTRTEDTSPLTEREYTPYGEIYTQASGDLLFGYTGHIALNPDTSSPIYAAPYRNYSPVSARWLTRDPLGMIDGPNVYGYVKDDPVNLTDPLGLACDPSRNTPRCRCPGEGYWSCVDRVATNCENGLCGAICNSLPGQWLRGLCWGLCIAFIGPVCLFGAGTGCLLPCSGSELQYCGH